MELEIEFSKQFERDELHNKFLLISSRIQIAALALAFLCSSLAEAFPESSFMEAAFTALLMVLFTQLLVIAKGMRFNVPVFATVLFFLPVMVFLLAEIFLFSAFPWRGEYSLAIALFPLIAFFFAQQQSRTLGGQKVLLATAFVAFIAILGSGVVYELTQGQNAHGNTGLFGSALLGFFSGEGAAGAIFILIFFTGLIFSLLPHVAVWVRLLSLYIALVAGCAIFFTHNAALWCSLLAGGAIATLFLVRQKSRRMVFLFLLGVALVGTFAFGDFNSGVTSRILVPTDVELTADERAEQVDYVLPFVAKKAFFESPVLGAGTGSFPEVFDRYSNAPQWQVSPKTAGNLYFTVLVENGIVGFLLLFVPAGVLLVRGFRACRKAAWSESSHGMREFQPRRRLDEGRVMLGGTLSGIVAIAVLFGLDYQGPTPAVLLYLGIFCGIAAREMRGSAFEQRAFSDSGISRKLVFAASFVFPIAAAFVFMPTFIAAKKYERAHAVLEKTLADSNTGTLAQRVSEDGLKMLINDFIAIAQNKPNHADVWCDIAAIYTVACNWNPAKAKAFSEKIDAAASRALAISPNLARAYTAKANVQMMNGDSTAAKESLEKALALAPENMPHVLQVAEIYRALPGEDATALRLFRRLARLDKTSSYIKQIEALLLLDPAADTSGSGVEPSKEEIPGLNESNFEI